MRLFGINGLTKERAGSDLKRLKKPPAPVVDLGGAPLAPGLLPHAQVGAVVVHDALVEVARLAGAGGQVHAVCGERRSNLYLSANPPN